MKLLKTIRDAGPEVQEELGHALLSYLEESLKNPDSLAYNDPSLFLSQILTLLHQPGGEELFELLWNETPEQVFEKFLGTT